MKIPGFWISHHPFPDKEILNQEEIKDLNFYIKHELELAKDITEFPPRFLGKALISVLSNTFNDFRKRELYLINGWKAPSRFYQKIKENMNINGIPFEIKVRFGFIVHYANQRVFPTNEGLYVKPMDVNFDELQNSALDIGTPLAILHRSSDGKWFYVVSPLSSGWVEVTKVALCNLKELSDFLNIPSFVVVTKAKGEIFLNPSLTEYYDYVRMGVRLPVYKEIDTHIIQIIIPFRKKDGALLPKVAYMRKDDVHEGYLPYTARNIIHQAFELLNAPYGWGGMYGEQDCSRFIQEVFATVGIILPRNSSQQAQIGLLVGEFDQNSPEEKKLDLLGTKAIGGITLLYLKGHIMLFWGVINDHPYAIHAIWAYRERVGWRSVVRVVNRVAITDLLLGKGSKKGSLLKKINHHQNNYKLKFLSETSIRGKFKRLRSITVCQIFKDMVENRCDLYGKRYLFQKGKKRRLCCTFCLQITGSR